MGTPGIGQHSAKIFPQRGKGMREGGHGEKGTSREKGKGTAANHAITFENSGASPENARRREMERAMAMEKAGAQHGRHKAA